jgi:hypothetical protein
MFTPIVAGATTTAITDGCHHRLPARNRDLGLLRPVASGRVAYGHWPPIGSTYSRGRFSDLDTLD